MNEHVPPFDSTGESTPGATDASATVAANPVAVNSSATAAVDAGLVIREVMNRLGTPNSLYRVTATEVYDKHFRVNVYCQRPTDDAFRPVVMTDSFFVAFGEDGISSQPPIQHRYGPVAATTAV
jgi:hypothetical protein